MKNPLNWKLPQQVLPDLSWSFAQGVARGLVCLEHVRAVELFGSIAREQHGNDLCFLLVVDEGRYHKFVQLYGDYVRYLIKREIFDRFSPEIIRRMVLSAIWDTHAPEWLRLNDFFNSNVHADVCVVPEGWRSKETVIRADFWFLRPGYLTTVYNEARPIATRRN